MAHTIGFIGFGEVASILAARLSENGATVMAYDALLAAPDGAALLEARRGGAAVAFAELEAVISASEHIISAVPTHLALDVAKNCAAHLDKTKTYLDVNSTSPWAKTAIGEAVSPTGARFIEGAVLGAVGATGADTKILFGGAHAQEAVDVFTKLGLRVEAFSTEIGKASVFKMLRSIFSKGMEALLVEALLAGTKAGVEKELWRDFVDTLENTPFSKTADNWVRSHGPACERRYHEMEQVLETMEGYGVAPVITSGTTALFKRSVELGLRETFRQKPETREQLIASLQTLIGENAASAKARTA
ncbi:NAD(P)-binding domain-containing protein [Desulfovibrio sp. OttesenSCG-928-O18]|nr:NAD(P)-binding domain-containing protein [Desulfovibrio sp. OttesenSCG-928-O18]